MPRRAALFVALSLAASLHAADPQPNVKLKFDDKGQPLPADRTESARARDALTDAKAELSKALGGINSMSNAAIENMLWRNDDYRKAVYDLRRAQSNYDAVRKPIFDALRLESYYRELEKNTEESQRVMKIMRATGRGSFDYLFPQAMTALKFRTRMTRAQIIAMAQAPEVDDARLRMLEAAAKVRAVRGEQTGGYSGKAVKQAKDAADSAREDVRQAQADYAKALAGEAAYEKLRQKWLVDKLQNGEKK